MIWVLVGVVAVVIVPTLIWDLSRAEDDYDVWAILPIAIATILCAFFGTLSVLYGVDQLTGYMDAG